MKKGWTTTKLITTGSLGVLILTLQLIPAVLNSVMPTRAVAGSLRAIVYTILTSVCLLLINRFGAAAFMYLIYGILALPFNLIGTPGFLLKVPITIIGGLMVDGIYLFLSRKSRVIGVMLANALLLMYFSTMVVFASQFFNIPGSEELRRLLFTPVGIAFNIGFGIIGGYLGYLIYQKIKDTAVVRRIQGGK